jgi:L-lactate dehydrogenase complex protein LldE
MVRHHYPLLFRDDPPWRQRAVAMASRTFELSEYLVDVLGVEDIGARFEGRLTYHESCQLAFGLGIRRQPRQLIRNLRGAEFIEMEAADRCCGFGGLFAVKYPAVSAAMVDEKVSTIAATGAEAVVGCDMGCLLNIQGRLNRLGLPIRALHLAQVLAGKS